MLDQILDPSLYSGLQTALKLLILVFLEAVLSADNALALAALSQGLEDSNRTYAWTPYIVGANGRSPLQMAVQQEICVSPVQAPASSPQYRLSCGLRAANWLDSNGYLGNKILAS